MNEEEDEGKEGGRKRRSRKKVEEKGIHSSFRIRKFKIKGLYVIVLSISYWKERMRPTGERENAT
jgi:hypothetical protein